MMDISESKKKRLNGSALMQKQSMRQTLYDLDYPQN